ncbi:hypothetical protein CD798_09850 [Bacillaceae bacterium SAOS 7]|nr:hypothetical protein CD798_09850 [Bacillaceae bacterium SAOS 7]
MTLLLEDFFYDSRIETEMTAHQRNRNGNWTYYEILHEILSYEPDSREGINYKVYEVNQLLFRENYR